MFTCIENLKESTTIIRINMRINKVVGYKLWQLAYKMAPMVPTFWDSCPCIVSSHAVPELLCVTNRIQQKLWHVPPRLGYKRHCGFHFSCLLSLSLWYACTRGSQLPCCEQPYWSCPCGEELKSLKSLEMDLPVPVKLSDDCTLGWRLDYNLMRNLEPKLSS